MNEKKRIRLLQVMNILFFIAMVTVNALANILPLNNQNTGEISDRYPNLFVPAGLTFSVWGVIYAALLLFTLFQLGVFTKKSGSHRDVVLRVNWLFALSSAANIAWIFAWHYNYVYASLGCMLVLLASLLLIQSKYDRKNPAPSARWFFQIPFSIYLGWITVATIANVTAVLVEAGWGGFGLSDVFWTAAVIIVAAIITVGQLALKKDIAFGLVVVWALAGIIIKHVTAFSSQYPIVVWTAAIASGVILVIIIMTAAKLAKNKVA